MGSSSSGGLRRWRRGGCIRMGRCDESNNWATYIVSLIGTSAGLFVGSNFHRASAGREHPAVRHHTMAHHNPTPESPIERPIIPLAPIYTQAWSHFPAEGFEAVYYPPSNFLGQCWSALTRWRPRPPQQPPQQQQGGGGGSSQN